MTREGWVALELRNQVSVWMVLWHCQCDGILMDLKDTSFGMYHFYIWSWGGPVNFACSASRMTDLNKRPECSNYPEAQSSILVQKALHLIFNRKQTLPALFISQSAHLPCSYNTQKGRPMSGGLGGGADGIDEGLVGGRALYSVVALDDRHGGARVRRRLKMSLQ